MSLLRPQPKVGMGIRMPETGRRQLFKRAPADPGLTQGTIGRPPTAGSPPNPAEDPGAAIRMQNFRKMMLGQSGPAGVQLGSPAPPAPPPIVPMTPMPGSVDQPQSVPMAPPPLSAGTPQDLSKQPPQRQPPIESENPAEDKAEGSVEEPIFRKTPNEMASY